MSFLRSSFCETRDAAACRADGENREFAKTQRSPEIQFQNGVYSQISFEGRDVGWGSCDVSEREGWEKTWGISGRTRALWTRSHCCPVALVAVTIWYRWEALFIFLFFSLSLSLPLRFSYSLSLYTYHLLGCVLFLALNHTTTTTNTTTTTTTLLKLS